MTNTDARTDKKRSRFDSIKSNKRIKASTIGEGTLFEGILNFQDMVKVCGCFKGEISSIGKLVVDKTGIVEADIHVTEIVVGGEVHGNITADKKIEILNSGKVFGNIQAPQTAINHCAVFKGHCSTGVPEKRRTPVIPMNWTFVEKPKQAAVLGVLHDESGETSAKNL